MICGNIFFFNYLIFVFLVKLKFWRNYGITEFWRWILKFKNSEILILILRCSWLDVSYEIFHTFQGPGVDLKILKFLEVLAFQIIKNISGPQVIIHAF